MSKIAFSLIDRNCFMCGGALQYVNMFDKYTCPNRDYSVTSEDGTLTECFIDRADNQLVIVVCLNRVDGSVIYAVTHDTKARPIPLNIDYRMTADQIRTQTERFRKTLVMS